ncbi:MAG TPA: hypothetical protein ENG91_03725 [Desulfobacteraceae bacterium]|nr:hypothetical protein [Desulfobacteraceae bacterium]
MEKYTDGVVIKIQARYTVRQHLEQLKDLFYHYHGTCPVQLTLHFDGRGEVDINILKDLKIRPCPEFFRKVDTTLGYPALTLRMKAPEIKTRKKNGYGNYNKNTSH